MFGLSVFILEGYKHIVIAESLHKDISMFVISDFVVKFSGGYSSSLKYYIYIEDVRKIVIQKMTIISHA